MIPDQIPAEVWDAAFRFFGSGLLFVGIIGISLWKKIEFEWTLVWSTIRGFTQILLLASVLTIIFELQGFLPLFAILNIMIVFGAHTAADRINNIENVFRIELISLGITVNFVMILMTILQVLPADRPEFWIPIGGMITGNSMNISYLTLDRLQNEVNNKKNEIEAALSLGGSPETVMERLGIISTSLRVGLTPNTNNLKTLGLVFIPGLMTGLLIGGMHPIAAAFLQVMIFFLILGGGAISSVIASSRATAQIFDMKNQTLPPGFGTTKVN